MCVFDPAIRIAAAHPLARGPGVESIPVVTPQNWSETIPMSASSRTMRRDLIADGNFGRKLPCAEKEQGRDHAAHSYRDKHGDDSFDPSPSPPIGFQVPHHILAVGSLTKKLERLAF